MGKFVAESKFLEQPDEYTRLVNAGDAVGIVKLLTNTEVERKVLRRAYTKASTYGQDSSGTTLGYKLNPMLIAGMFKIISYSHLSKIFLLFSVFALSYFCRYL